MGSKRKTPMTRKMRRKDSLSMKKHGSVFGRSKSKNKISVNSKSKQKQEEAGEKFVDVVWEAH